MTTTPPDTSGYVMAALAAALAVGAAATPPACVRCGATCDLEPICVCSPGTKKVPKTEYDVACEPICVAACGSTPWSRGLRTPAAGCSCVDVPCDCPGRVREVKRLRKQTVEEETCVVERRVEYLCSACSGRTAVGCCGGKESRVSTWWARLTDW